MRDRNQDWRDLLRIPWLTFSWAKICVATACFLVQVAGLELLFLGYTGLVAARDLARAGVGATHLFEFERWPEVGAGILATRGAVELSLLLGAAWLWLHIVFSWFGAVLFRMTAVEICTGERARFSEARRFAKKKFKAFLWTPLAVLIGVAFFAGANALGGTVGRVGVVGPVLVALFFWLALVLSALAVVLLAGFLLGWDLMMATIAVEGTDPFDGISRGMSYVYVQPARFLAYRLVGGLWGAVSFAMVVGLAGAVYLSAVLAVRFGMGEGFDTSLWQPALELGRTFLGSASSGVDLTVAGTVFFAVSALYALGFVGYALAMKSGLAVAQYLLLRRALDGTDTTEIWTPDAEKEPPAEVEEESELTAAAGAGRTGS